MRQLTTRLRQLVPEICRRLPEPERQRFNDIQVALFCHDCAYEELLRDLRQWAEKMEGV